MQFLMEIKVESTYLVMEEVLLKEMTFMVNKIFAQLHLIFFVTYMPPFLTFFLFQQGMH